MYLSIILITIMQCCICLEDLGNPWDTGLTLYACCGRSVHTKCGHEASKHKSTCPWCRGPLPGSNEECLSLLRAGVCANKGWAYFRLGEHYRGQTSVGSDRLALALHERAIVHFKKDIWSQKFVLGSKYIIAVILYNQHAILYNQDNSQTMSEPVRKRIRKLLTEAAAGGHPRARIALETMLGI